MTENQDIIYGRQTVREALAAGSVKRLFLLKGQKASFSGEIKLLAQKKGVTFQEVDSKVFEEMVNKNSAAGGVAAEVFSYQYAEIDTLIKNSPTAENLLILVLDHIEDPHNLGALIRTAEAAGVSGIIIPAKRAAKVTATVRKVAAGAAEWLAVVQVTNISQALDYLKEHNFWVYGAEADSDLNYAGADWNRSVALVLGSEGKGLSALIKKKCDLLINIPMAGRLNSLNVSVAGGILMFEHLRRKP